VGSGCSQLSAYAARGKVAEGEGFEPPLGCPKPVFKIAEHLVTVGDSVRREVSKVWLWKRLDDLVGWPGKTLDDWLRYCCWHHSGTHPNSEKRRGGGNCHRASIWDCSGGVLGSTGRVS